jgi:hypothetical protein
MKIPQLSLFISNSPGTLADIAAILGEIGVNIRAMSLADTNNFGVLRMVLDDADKARQVLKDYGYPVRSNEVIAVEIADRPGSLGALLRVLADAGRNVEYMYAFVQKNAERAVLILRLDDLDGAIACLQGAGVTVLSGAELYAL